MTEHFSVMLVGSGYVGLVTGACLSHAGHRVVRVDKEIEERQVLSFAGRGFALLSRCVRGEELRTP
jgi:UDP-glucose 6-dehydrogenase